MEKLRSIPRNKHVSPRNEGRVSLLVLISFPPKGENFLASALIRASLEITNSEEVVETRVPGHDPTPTSPSCHTARYQEE